MKNETASTPIFDESYVECNECKHYWNDVCDGVPEDKERPCTAFVAVKRTDFNDRLVRVENKVQAFGRSLLILNGVVTAHLLIELINSIMR